MVEQEAVNFEVAGSSPASGAKVSESGLQAWLFYFDVLETRTSNRRFGGTRTRTGACSEHAGVEKCFWQSQKCALSGLRSQA